MNHYRQDGCVGTVAVVGGVLGERTVRARGIADRIGCHDQRLKWWTIFSPILGTNAALLLFMDCLGLSLQREFMIA
jgi:hypothetical protein